MINFTPEQRQANLIKAYEARQAKKLEREANLQHMKADYLDMSYWCHLATQHKVRMPMAGVIVSAKEIRKALKKCNVSVETFDAHYTSMKYFVANNGDWSAQAVTGLILELKA